MLYELKIRLINSKNYCINYIKKLVDKYLDIFIKQKYNNLYIKDNLNDNKYLIDFTENNDIYDDIEYLLVVIEKHIKNIYPECGSSWKLNFSYEKVLSN
jgi:DNA-dependent RNA polymerase auxiliary subunit epsilon